MDKAKAYIDEHKERFVGELFELLRIPSVSAQSVHAPDVVRCAELLAGLLVRSGADRAEVMPTEGNPIVYAEKIVDPAAKTVLVYGHYDVMPVDPPEGWKTDPFEPVIEDGRIRARGADDDKGQLYMHVKALETMLQTGTLGCNVKFMIEGEEEIGSGGITEWCGEHRELLKADVILVSDTSLLSWKVPSITCGLRGLCYAEVEVTGPNRDLHSGLYGGAVANPMPTAVLPFPDFMTESVNFPRRNIASLPWRRFAKRPTARRSACPKPGAKRDIRRSNVPESVRRWT